MTHVILTRNGDDKYIEFPIQPTFQSFLTKVRALEPDRTWEIFESWEA
jgi:hypothetical protein